MSLLEAVSPTAKKLLSAKIKAEGRARTPLRAAGQQRSAVPTLFERVAVRVITQIKNRQRGFAWLEFDDERLIRLQGLLAPIGDDALVFHHAREAAEREQCLVNLQFGLSNLAAFCVLWLTPGDRDWQPALELIHKERERQKELHAANKLGVCVSGTTADNRRKFRVLAEEVGEVAHAIDQIENHGMAAGNLRMEITHVAAVACAWLEALEQELS